MPERKAVMPNLRLLAVASMSLLLVTASASWGAEAAQSDPAVVQASAPAPDKALHPAKQAAPGEGPGHGGHLRAAPLFRDVTDEDIADIVAFVDANLPWLRPELDKMRDSDPDRFRQVCRFLGFEFGQLKDLKEHDPGAFSKAIEERQLRSRAADLANKARAATDPKEHEAFVAELRTVLDKLFAAEMVTREAQVRQLEHRLNALREDLKQREASREQIISSRLDDLLKGKRAPESPLKAELKSIEKFSKPEKSDKADKGDKGDKK